MKLKIFKKRVLKMSWYAQMALLVVSTYAKIPSTVDSVNPDPVNQQLTQNSCLAQYRPFSSEAKYLFSEAASEAGVPRSWAYSPGLHSILQKESNGIVGIPNYTIKDQRGNSAQNNRDYWKVAHEKIRNYESIAPSHATGLGQLQPENVDRYYPSGRAGIGDCREEAIGMLRYIKAAYGSPNTAWSCYGKLKPELCPKKRFKEGY